MYFFQANRNVIPVIRINRGSSNYIESIGLFHCDSWTKIGIFFILRVKEFMYPGIKNHIITLALNKGKRIVYFDILPFIGFVFIISIHEKFLIFNIEKNLFYKWNYRSFSDCDYYVRVKRKSFDKFDCVNVNNKFVLFNIAVGFYYIYSIIIVCYK